MLRWLAHAGPHLPGEEHEGPEEVASVVQGTPHAWLLVVLYFLVLAAIWFGFERIKPLAHYRFIAILAVSMVTVFAGYGISPPLSVIAIMVGFGTSLLLMLVSAKQE